MLRVSWDAGRSWAPRDSLGWAEQGWYQAPQATLTCMLAVASPSMPPKVMALVTVAR